MTIFGACFRRGAALLASLAALGLTAATGPAETDEHSTAAILRFRAEKDASMRDDPQSPFKRAPAVA